LFLKPIGKPRSQVTCKWWLREFEALLFTSCFQSRNSEELCGPWFVWQGFGSGGGGIGVTFVRSCEKLPLSLIKPVPAGSKTDLLLAKAKPVSDSGSTSVIYRIFTNV